jgi:membrane-associated phospholipid phosphatase
LLLAVAAGGCAGDNRFARHGHGDVWSGALREQVQEPWRAVPEATLLATSLALIPFDDQIQDSIAANAPNHSVDAIDYALWGAPILWGAITWARGDEGTRFEVAGEAVGATTLTTVILKGLSGRTRPDRTANSFPSGHTSSAFAGATLLARFIERETKSKLGYLFYLPAAYIGVERVRDNRHWATDVAAGAFIGTFLTNLIFDAHYGNGKRHHPGIYDPPRVQASVAPLITERATGIVLRLDF